MVAEGILFSKKGNTMFSVNLSALPPIAQQPETKETTLRKNILEKVAIFGILLGSGLILASFFTALTTIPLISGAALTALSAYAFYYLSNIDSSGALIKAADTGNRCMVNFLLFLGANPNANPEDNALSIAAVNGQSEIIKDLLNAGANPNIMDWHNRTPLYEAISQSQDDAVKILLEYGADPQIQTIYIHGRGNSIETALQYQEFFNTPDRDRCIGSDNRTRDERKTASDRIVEMLRPYMQEQAPHPEE